jgi:hypothetical protein
MAQHILNERIMVGRDVLSAPPAHHQHSRNKSLLNVILVLSKFGAFIYPLKTARNPDFSVLSTAHWQTPSNASQKTKTPSIAGRRSKELSADYLRRRIIERPARAAPIRATVLPPSGTLLSLPPQTQTWERPFGGPLPPGL